MPERLSQKAVEATFNSMMKFANIDEIGGEDEV